MFPLRPFFLFVVFLAGLFLPWLPGYGKTLEGRVLRVFDGDTLLIRVEGVEEHVRLREIDAPEVTNRRQKGQEPWGGRAKHYLQGIIQGKRVRLEIEDHDVRDKYHRILAYVFFDGLMINRAMVQSGNAFYYPSPGPGKYSRILESAEMDARRKGVGIWDRKNGLKERPAQFRERLNRDEALFSAFPQRVRNPTEKKTFQEFPVPEGKFVGNQRSRLYHYPGSPYAKRVNPKNRIYFHSKEEAEKAGFRPAQRQGGGIGDERSGG